MTWQEAVQTGLLWLAPNVQVVGIIVFSWAAGIFGFAGLSPLWWRDW